MTMPICKECQQPFDGGEPIQVLGCTLRANVCNRCDEARTADEARRVHSRRLEAFVKLCPPAYRATEPARLDQDKLAQVLAWQYGPRGLVLFGSTRLGKTRCAWLLLKPLVLAGRRVVALTAGEFARQCADAYGHSAEAGARFFRRMTACDVLFIDDFGKFKVTERVEAELFDIIEFRTGHGLPILLTTNGTKATFAQAFSPDRSGPIFGRLREFCEFINFSPAKAT